MDRISFAEWAYGRYSLKMKKFITFVAVLFFVVLPVKAEEVNNSLVDKAQDYFDGLASFEATFLQTSTKEGAEKASGKMYYKKPGNLRIDYDKPTPYLIVSSGTWLIYYDKELEQVTHLPVSETPARFLLDKNIKLKDTFTVKSAEQNGKAIKVHLLPKQDIGATDIIFGFRDEGAGPLGLDYWIVRDGQGVETTVVLQDLKKNVALEDKLFRFINPKFFQKK